MLHALTTAGLLLSMAPFITTALAGSTTDPTPVFCSDTGSANCRSAFRESKRDWLLAATEGTERTTARRDPGLQSVIQQMHMASANQSSSRNSAEAPPIKRNGPSGFVFDASSIRHSTKPALLIRLGKKISRQALKRRFAGYDVRYAKGEGCLICAVITGPDGQFDVDFDQDGRTVIHLRSTDNRIRDVRGNEIGSSLRSALGADTSICDAGESTTCASAAFKGLSYIVTEDDRCLFSVKDKQPTDIPACARIGGFQIQGD